MATALDLVQQPGSREARGQYHGYFPTRTLADNLRVFKAIVWRDYMRADVLALADQIREGIGYSWDPAEVAMAVWQHMTVYPYIAPPAGEELYLDFAGFQRRGGGDCDNKTLTQCCLLLASGVICRAVVIELPLANGAPSGDGHMYCECLLPRRGWVAFDASKDHPMPGTPGHKTYGFVRQTVEFTGDRPQEAAIMNALTTRGYVQPQVGLLTGMLTGQGTAICGPQPDRGDPLYSSWAACVAEGESEKPGWLESLFGRVQAVTGEGLFGAYKRKLTEWGLAPQEEGPMSTILPIAIGAAVIGGTIWAIRRFAN